MSVDTFIEWKPALRVAGVTSYIANPKAGLTFKQPIGKPETVSFVVDGEDPILRLLVELETDILLYRDLHPDPVFRGRLISLDDSAADVYTVALTAVAYGQLLQTRMVPEDVNYWDVPQADLVWSLIQSTQAQDSGDLGITAGVLNSGGQTRQKQLLAGVYIGKTIDDLHDNINGFDWWIDPALQLQVATPRRQRATSFVLTYPGGNVASANRKSTAAQFRNVDRETGDAGTVPVVALGTFPDPRGRWEVSNGNSGVTEQKNLVDKAVGNIAESSRPRATWSVTLQAGAWGDTLATEPGDVVRFQFRRGRFNVDTDVRIIEQQFQVAQSGATVVTMSLLEE